MSERDGDDCGGCRFPKDACPQAGCKRVDPYPERAEHVAKWLDSFSTMATVHEQVHDGTYIGPLTIQEWLNLELLMAYDDELLETSLRILFGDGTGPAEITGLLGMDGVTEI